MARTKITTDRPGYVTVERDDPMTGERESTTYFVRADGETGYVRIQDRDCRFPQVCYGLCSTGSTLMATADTLPAVIRRELRRAQRDERREESRYALR